MSSFRPPHWIISICTIITLLLPRYAPAQQEAMPEPQKKAVAAGTTWLLQRQNDDGAIRAARGRTAVTALAGLALIAAGSTADAGEHRQPIRKAAEYIIAKATADGVLSDETSSPMYNHGFALLFLCEVYSTTKDDELKARLKPVIEKAIALAEKSQNRDGGWRYQPRPMDADVSVTAAQVNALNAARRAGFALDKQVLPRGQKYLEDCRNADGGFSYLAGGKTASGPARSAAALAVLLHTGLKHDGAEAREALAYLDKADKSNKCNHYFYLHYYHAQNALHFPALKEYRQAIADELVKSQLRDGRWHGDAGEEYGTAMALLVLQLPYHPPAVFKPDAVR